MARASGSGGDQASDDEMAVMDPYMAMLLVDDEGSTSPVSPKSSKRQRTAVQPLREQEEALNSIRKKNEELLKVKEEKDDSGEVPGPSTPPGAPPAAEVPQAGGHHDEMEEIVEERDDGWSSWNSWSWNDGWSSWSWNDREGSWGDEHWRGHREVGRGRGGGRGGYRGGGGGGGGYGGGWKGGKGRHGRHHGGKAESHGAYTNDGRFIDSWGNVQPLLDFISLDFLFVTLSHSLSLSITIPEVPLLEHVFNDRDFYQSIFF